MLEEKTIYLDYQASTPLAPSALEKMVPFLQSTHANPHSNDHIEGWKANKAIENARSKVAQAIKADSDEIVFTSGATEANNFAIKGVAQHLKKVGKTKIITSSIEHKCVLECFEHLKNNDGFETVYLPSNSDGIIEPDQLNKAIDETVGLVSIMFVNNEIGTVQPIEELANIAHKHGAIFHTDAAQAPIFLDIDVKVLGADIISFSSHKIYGPKGIGAAFVNRDIKQMLTPLIHGGGQEDGLRSGTLPTMLCVGFGEAFDYIALSRENNHQILKKLSMKFLKELKTKVPNIEINGTTENRHPGNLNIRFPGVKAQDFLQTMQPHICASTGSACNSGIEAPSYVLNEIGLCVEAAAESVRFSFGIDQSESIIKEAANFIAQKYLGFEKEVAA
tara:strand:+ start:2580 stop:3752 length:1173 start_codon:yes stop_codon:yes gene_type:complete